MNPKRETLVGSQIIPNSPTKPLAYIPTPSHAFHIFLPISMRWFSKNLVSWIHYCRVFFMYLLFQHPNLPAAIDPMNI